MTTTPRVLLTAVVLACLGSAPFAGASRAEPIFIVHSAVAETQVDEATLANLYLGKKTRWSSGEKVFLGVLREGATHDRFLGEYVRQTPAQFSAVWKKAIFTGTGVPPKTFDQEADLAAYVAATPGALGYVDAATPHPGVKVLPVR